MRRKFHQDSTARQVIRGRPQIGRAQLLTMRERDKHRFELRGRGINPTIEHRMEESGEGGGVGAPRVVGVADRVRRPEMRQQGATTVDAGRAFEGGRASRRPFSRYAPAASDDRKCLRQKGFSAFRDRRAPTADYPRVFQPDTRDRQVRAAGRFCDSLRARPAPWSCGKSVVAA